MTTTEAKARAGIRYLLVRNLVIPGSIGFSAARQGLQAEVECADHGVLRSEPSWGSKEAMWLIGEGALGNGPFTIRIFVVEPPSSGQQKLQQMSDRDLMESFARSTLANPLRKPSFVEAEDAPTKTLVYERTIDRLVPLNNATTRDLVHLPLPLDSILFSVEHSGRLFTSAPTANAVFGLWGLDTLLEPSPNQIQEVDTEDKDDETSFARLSAMLGEDAMAEALQIAERILAAREASDRARQAIEDALERRSRGAARLLEQRRKEELRRRLEMRREALLVEFESLQRKVQAEEIALEVRLKESRLRAANSTARRREMSQQMEEELSGMMKSARIASRCLLGRRLVLAADVLRVYQLPHSLSSTQIREYDLESASEDERAVALGYLAHLVSILAALFEVTLRYTPVPFGSRSFMMDSVFFAPVIETAATPQLHRIETLSATSALSATSGLFPLFSFGVERGAKRKCETAVQLLVLSIGQLVETVRVRALPSATNNKEHSSTMHSRTPERTVSSLGNSIARQQGGGASSLIVEGLSRLKLLLAELRLFPPYESTSNSNRV